MNAVTWKFTENYRRMRSLLDKNNVATNLAEAVANMDFADLGYLDAIHNPSRIKKAFQKIFRNLQLKS